MNDFLSSSRPGSRNHSLAASKTRYNKSKLTSAAARVAQAADDLALALAPALADFAKSDAPPILGIQIAYGVQSSDDDEGCRAR